MCPEVSRLAPYEIRFPAATVESARQSFCRLAHLPQTSSLVPLRKQYSHWNMLCLLQGSTPQDRLGSRIIDLPRDVIVSWLIGNSPELAGIETMDDEMTAVVVKGGHVGQVCRLLNGELDKLPKIESELDVIPMRLDGHVDPLHLCQILGLPAASYDSLSRDGNQDYGRTRTNPSLHLLRQYGNGKLVAEMYRFLYPDDAYALFDDIVRSPITFSSMRLIITSNGTYLFDPLGGLHHWYGQKPPIAAAIHRNELRETLGIDFPYAIGFAYVYALASAVVAGARVGEETIRILAADLYLAVSHLGSDGELVISGVTAHLQKFCLRFTGEKQRRFSLLTCEVAMRAGVDCSVFAI